MQEQGSAVCGVSDLQSECVGASMLFDVCLQHQGLSIEALEQLLLERRLSHDVQVSLLASEVGDDDGVTGLRTTADGRTNTTGEWAVPMVGYELDCVLMSVVCAVLRSSSAP